MRGKIRKYLYTQAHFNQFKKGYVVDMYQYFEWTIVSKINETCVD